LKSKIPDQILTSDNPSISFVVEVADNGNPVLTFSRSFSLPLTAVNITHDGLPDILLNNVQVHKTYIQGHILGNIIAEEKATENIEITLETNFDGLFQILDRNNLVLTRDAYDVSLTVGTIEVRVHNTETLETKSASVSIEMIDDTSCKVISLTCGDNEQCVAHNNTHGVCECEADFNLVDDICVQNDHCQGVVCQNSGSCVNEIDKYVCQCTDNYTGEHCEIDASLPSPCEPNPCLNEGICIPNTG